MRHRTSDVHIFFPQKQLDELDDDVEMEKFQNRSHAILYYVRMGRKLDEIKYKCKDPAIRKIIDDHWDKFKIEDSFKSLTVEELEYLAKAIEMTKDSKIKQLILES